MYMWCSEKSCDNLCVQMRAGNLIPTRLLDTLWQVRCCGLECESEIGKSRMTFQIKKRINMKLFIDRTSAVNIDETLIRDKTNEVDQSVDTP